MKSNYNLNISQQTEKEISLKEYSKLFKMLLYFENFSTNIKLHALDSDSVGIIPKKEQLKFLGGPVEFTVKSINKNSPLYIDLIISSSVLFDEILKLLIDPITFDQFMKFLEDCVYKRKLSQEEKARYYQEFKKIQKYNSFIRKMILLFDLKNE